MLSISVRVNLDFHRPIFLLFNEKRIAQRNTPNRSNRLMNQVVLHSSTIMRGFCYALLKEEA